MIVDNTSKLDIITMRYSPNLIKGDNTEQNKWSLGKDDLEDVRVACDDVMFSRSINERGFV
jgi:hypothetical protein